MVRKECDRCECLIGVSELQNVFRCVKRKDDMHIIIQQTCLKCKEEIDDVCREVTE